MLGQLGLYSKTISDWRGGGARDESNRFISHKEGSCLTLHNMEKKENHTEISLVRVGHQRH